MGAEPRYTLDEARRELVRRECGTRGHDWYTIVIDGTGEPTSVICDRCGESRTVQPKEGDGRP